MVDWFKVQDSGLCVEVHTTTSGRIERACLYSVYVNKVDMKPYMLTNIEYASGRDPLLTFQRMCDCPDRAFDRLIKEPLEGSSGRWFVMDTPRFSVNFTAQDIRKFMQEWVPDILPGDFYVVGFETWFRPLSFEQPYYHEKVFMWVRSERVWVNTARMQVAERCDSKQLKKQPS